ncbi:MAG: TetR/AcrR family transcriptional regulator [Bifidobacteriaceae bacterium]|nr:TetR/AcrR family transcriptional regulator [Bifidobacteriaceae bacterium]
MRSQSSFARARTEEQRAARRAAILEAAASMLAASRVAEFSLNELARRVCLAKSNVLRYFESREAVLRELLGLEYDAWLDAIEQDLRGLPGRPQVESWDGRCQPRGLGQSGSGDQPAPQRGQTSPGEPGPAETRGQVDRVSLAVARTAAARPMMCELLSSATVLLERNVSADAAAAYKRKTLARAERLVDTVTAGLPITDPRSRLQLAGAVNIIVGGVWSLSQPSPGMRAAYQAHPDLAVFRLDFEEMVRELVAVVLAGLIARR